MHDQRRQRGTRTMNKCTECGSSCSEKNLVKKSSGSTMSYASACAACLRGGSGGAIGRVSGGRWGEKVEREGERHGVLLVPFAF